MSFPSAVSAFSYQPLISKYEDQPALPSALSLGDKILYKSTRPVAVVALYRIFSPSLFTMFGYKEFYQNCRELLLDLGGETVSIQTKDGLKLDGMYFDPAKVKMKEAAAFKKWKDKFASHKQTAKLLEVDLEGKDMTTLLGVPTVESHPNGKIKGVVMCMGAGGFYEADPQSVMIYANHGKPLLLFNYRGILTNKGTPDAKGTFTDTASACQWLKTHLDCEANELLIHGKSMGASNALYAGTQFPGMDVIVDRGFYSLSEVAVSKVSGCMRGPVTTLIEKFYGYRNDQMIKNVAGRVFIMKAADDTLIPADHADRLFENLVSAKLGDFASPEQVAAFKNRYFVVVPGTHAGIAGGDPSYAWTRYPESYVAFHEFLRKEE